MGFINTTHLKVLLKKDFLTLWRNKAYIAAFILLPIALMSAFKAIVGLIEEDKTQGGGSMLEENFKYASNVPLSMGGFNTLMPFGDIPPVKEDPFQMMASSIKACGLGPVARAERNSDDDWTQYDAIAIISADDTVRANAVSYFESYVFPKIDFTAQGFKVEGLKT